MSQDSLRVGVVTAYPPSRATLNEYGQHLVKALAAKPDVDEVVLIRDEVDGDVGPLPTGVTDHPAWRFGSWTTPLRVLRAVRQSDPDVVLLNAHFTSFGATKISAALGLMTILVLRIARIRTQVLLHNVVEAVDLSNAGFSSGGPIEWALRKIGRLMTRIVLSADVVTVTIPRYIEILQEHYGATNVVLTPHGAFDDPGELDPAALDLPDGPFQILAFGKFGTYKKVDDLADAVRLLAERGVEDVELVVAGTDSPNAPGYLDGVAESCADLPNVRFTGYVAEEDVPTLFGEAGAVVFPYTSTTGSSGVLHQAGSYAAATVLPELGDFVDLVRDEGFDGVTFEPDSVESLADAIASLHADDAQRRRLGARNHAAARGVPMADVADWHLLHLGRLARAA